MMWSQIAGRLLNSAELHALPPADQRDFRRVVAGTRKPSDLPVRWFDRVESILKSHPIGSASRSVDYVRGEHGEFAKAEDAIEHPTEETLHAALASVLDSARQNPDWAVRVNKVDGDPVLQEISKRIGFDGPPTVVSKKEMDAAVAAGAREMWRGVAERRFADTLRGGDMRYGTGLFGSGIYTAWGPQAASEASTYGPTIVRMALSPDAKVADGKELERQMHDEGFSKIAGGESPEDYRKRFQAEVDVQYRNLGRYAMLNGYDAVVWGKETAYSRAAASAGIALLLNRSAWLVESDDRGSVL